MKTATFRFHGDLNFFLPRKRKYISFDHSYDGRVSIKDMVEALGVPHTEIERMTANSAAIDFNHIVEQDDSFEVYATFDSIHGQNGIPLRPPFPGRPAFVLDQHLGRLAAYLRMMGFDTLYRNDYHDEELAQVSHDETRILLTRDTGLLKRSLVVYGYFVRETNRQKQLAEITRRFKLLEAIAPFKHCIKCNGLLEAVAKETVHHQLPDGTAQYYDEFHRCGSCQQVYWKGPHYRRMQALMGEVIEEG